MSAPQIPERAYDGKLIVKATTQGLQYICENSSGYFFYTLLEYVCV